MSNQPVLINSLLEQSDPFIRQHGGEKGYQMFRQSEVESIAPEDFIKLVAPQYISYIENDDPDTPFYAQTLLSMYEWSERNGKTPEFLKTWALDRTLRASQGESADTAFHLKPRVGGKKTKPQHNQLRCVSFVALKMREGMSKTDAVKACSENLGATERTIYGFLKDVMVGEHISNNTLIFFRDNDISDDYSPY